MKTEELKTILYCGDYRYYEVDVGRMQIDVDPVDLVATSARLYGLLREKGVTVTGIYDAGDGEARIELEYPVG